MDDFIIIYGCGNHLTIEKLIISVCTKSYDTKSNLSISEVDFINKKVIFCLFVLYPELIIHIKLLNVSYFTAFIEK